MFPSKQKTIKSMFSLNRLKKVRKAISKFFLFNEDIRHIEDSKDVREADDDCCGGENVRVFIQF